MGGVIGDAIFPGLGTVGGLLLGGYGGRKRAGRKERRRERGEDEERYPADDRSDFENEHGRGGRERGGEERRERYPADYRSDFENERGMRGHRDSGYGGDDYGNGKEDWERRSGGSGWDEGSGTYKKGVAVR